jgi:hypothetical protein
MCNDEKLEILIKSDRNDDKPFESDNYAYQNLHAWPHAFETT